jgi:Omp85 superfamily domain
VILKTPSHPNGHSRADTTANEVPDICSIRGGTQASICLRASRCCVTVYTSGAESPLSPHRWRRIRAVKCGQRFADAAGMRVLVIALLLGTSGPVLAQQTPSSELPAGWVMPSGLIGEPALLRKAGNASDGIASGGDARDGFYPDLGHMITGAGWISAGPGYRQHLAGGTRIDVSAAISWRFYKVAQARLELPRFARQRLLVGMQGLYQDLLQVNYFGIGADSRVSDRSGYRFHNGDVSGYATARLTDRLSAGGRIGWILQPHLSTMTGRRAKFPNTSDLFSEASAPGLLTQPSFLHGELSVAADWRDHAGHPTRGGFYRASAARYLDRDAGSYSFRRYEVEGSQFIPFFTRRLVVALHGWEVFTGASGGETVPFYLMPSLGGGNTLRSYFNYRFHDRNAQSFTVESRIAIFTHLDTAAFIDAGKVAPRPGDLDFKRLQTGYGVGVRLHNATSTLVRLDFGHGAEGWRTSFTMRDPFRRSAPTAGGASVVPFVP